MSIYKNFLLIRSDSLPRKWRVQKPLLNTSDRWPETYQWHKFILCDINALTFWLETIPRESRPQLQGRNCKTTSPQNFPHPGSPLISRSWICILTNVPGVVIHYMPKDSNVLQENFNAKYVTNLGISPQYVIRGASSQEALLKLENPKHSNFEQEPYTPITMLIEVDLNCWILKNHFVYR